MSLICIEIRDIKCVVDLLYDLCSKLFFEWGEDEIRCFNLIDVFFEFVYIDIFSLFGIGMIFDYMECWEIGVCDDCLVMICVKLVYLEYVKYWNMKGVMNDKICFYVDKWVGYSKVFVWVSLLYKDIFMGVKWF